MLDWQIFSRAVRVGSAPAVWSRFPVELAPNLIVCPHLFDWDRSGRDRSEEEVYTCASVPLLMVFCGRGEHLRFLQTEVMPRVRRHARHTVLVDADQGRFAVDGESESLHPLSALGPLLAAAYGANFDELLEQLSKAVGNVAKNSCSEDEIAGGQRERAQACSIRLWEALFWRGHAYRYELVEDEVPLVGNLLTPLAANRTLMQFVQDAKRLEGVEAYDEAGWIRCGRFRMRQRDSHVLVRVRASPADVRAAFMPQARVAGDRVLPSLTGVLMAGGDNGKTELWNGWTWAAAILDSHHAAQELARRLTVEIEQWVGAPASIASESFRPPDDPRDEWFLLPYDRYLTVYVPFHRENCFPWDVHDECYWRQPLEHG